MAERNPELQAKLQELDHELEVSLFSKLILDSCDWGCLNVPLYPCYDVGSHLFIEAPGILSLVWDSVLTVTFQRKEISHKKGRSGFGTIKG